jgi:hypothetical protein
MDLFDVIRACIRRWYVSLPLVAVALLYAYHTYSTVKPVFYSNAIIGISAPNSQVPWGNSGEAIPQNGLLATGGPALLSQMLVFGLNDAEVINKVVSDGGKPSYTVRMFPTGGDLQNSALPLLMIETTQPDSESAKKTVELVAGNAGPVLRQIQEQAGVPESLMVRALVASPPGAPKAGTPSRTRSAFAMLAAGLGAAVLAAVLVDTTILRRSNRRSSGASPAAHAGSQQPLTPDQRPALQDRVH